MAGFWDLLGGVAVNAANNYVDKVNSKKRKEEQQPADMSTGSVTSPTTGRQDPMANVWSSLGIQPKSSVTSENKDRRETAPATQPQQVNTIQRQKPDEDIGAAIRSRASDLMDYLTSHAKPAGQQTQQTQEQPQVQPSSDRAEAIAHLRGLEAQGFKTDSPTYKAYAEQHGLTVQDTFGPALEREYAALQAKLDNPENYRLENGDMDRDAYNRDFTLSSSLYRLMQEPYEAPEVKIEDVYDLSKYNNGDVLTMPYAEAQREHSELGAWLESQNAQMEATGAQPSEEYLRNYARYQSLDIHLGAAPGISRVWTTLKGRLETTLGSLVGSGRAMYEAGQGARDQYMSTFIEDKQTEIERLTAEYQYEYEYAQERGVDPETDPSVAAAKSALEFAQTQLEAYKAAPEIQRNATEATHDLASAIIEEGEQRAADAKIGIDTDTAFGKVKSTLLDLWATSVDMAFDATVGRISPLLGANSPQAAGLTSMFWRVFGQKATQTKSDGASFGSQLGSATWSASIEVLSELILGGSNAGKATYGKGILDGAIDKVKAKFLKNKTVRRFAESIFGRMTKGGIEESVEEFVPPIANALARVVDSVIDKATQALGSNQGKTGTMGADKNWVDYIDADTMGDTLYGVLLGFLLGFAGSAPEVLTGGPTAPETLRSFIPEAENVADNGTGPSVQAPAANEEEQAPSRTLPEAEAVTDSGTGARPQARQEATESFEDEGDASIPESTPESTSEASDALNTKLSEKRAEESKGERFQANEEANAALKNNFKTDESKTEENRRRLTQEGMERAQAEEQSRNVVSGQATTEQQSKERSDKGENRPTEREALSGEDRTVPRIAKKVGDPVEREGESVSFVDLKGLAESSKNPIRIAEVEEGYGHGTVVAISDSRVTVKFDTGETRVYNRSDVKKGKFAKIVPAQPSTYAEQEASRLKPRFEDDPIELKRFIGGQATYSQYSVDDRLAVLRAMYPENGYYLRGGEIVEENKGHRTSTGQSRQRGDTRTGSNFAKPKPARAKKPSVKGTVGEKVVHSKYGSGEIIGVDNSRFHFENRQRIEDTRYKVKFNNGETHTFTVSELGNDFKPNSYGIKGLQPKTETKGEQKNGDEAKAGRGNPTEELSEGSNAGEHSEAEPAQHGLQQQQPATSKKTRRIAEKYWGRGCSVNQASNEAQHSVEKTAHRIAGGDVRVLFVAPGEVDSIERRSQSGKIANGTTFIDEDGRVTILLFADNPGDKIGQTATAIHEAVHAKLITKYGDAKYSAPLSLLQKFNQEKRFESADVEYIVLNIAMSYYDQSKRAFGLPNYDFNDLSIDVDTRIANITDVLNNYPDYAGKVANEFFSFLSSGTIGEGAHKNTDIDALQNAVQQFLTDNDVVDPNAFQGAPKASEVNQASAEKHNVEAKSDKTDEDDLPFAMGEEESEAPASEQPSNRWSEQTSNQDVPGDVTETLNEMSADQDADVQKAIELLKSQGYDVSGGPHTDSAETNAENRASEDYQVPPTAEQLRERAVSEFGGKAHARLEKMAAKLRELGTPFADKMFQGKHLTEEQERFRAAYDNVVETAQRVVDGTAVIEDLMNAYDQLCDKKITGSERFEDADIRKMIDAVKGALSLYETSSDNSGGAHTAYHERVNEFASVFETRMSIIVESIGDQRQANSEIKNSGFANKGSDFPRAVKSFMHDQLRPDVFFKMLGGFKKKASTMMYKLAGMVDSSVNRIRNVSFKANSFFHSASDMAGADKWTKGQVKAKTKIGDHEVSQNVALEMLKVLEDQDGFQHVLNGGVTLPAEKHSHGARDQGEKVTFFDRSKWTDYYQEVYEEKQKELEDAAKLDAGNADGTFDAEAEEILRAAEEDIRKQARAETTRRLNADRENAQVELVRLRDALRAELLQEGSISKAMYDASIKAMTYLAGEVNGVSNKLLGIDLATKGKNYWSLSMAGDGLNSSANATGPRSLTDMRILQQRTGNTGGIQLNGFTESMSRYIRMASDYVGFAELTDTLELMEKPFSPDNAEGSTLSGAAAQLDRKNATWLRNYIDDLNGRRDSGNSFFSTLRGNLAQSSLLLNPGVAIKQTPSFLDFAGEVPIKYLAKYLITPHTTKTLTTSDLAKGVGERSSVLTARQVGYNLPEMVDAEQASKFSQKILSIVPQGMKNWINKMDVRTVVRGMMAVGDWVADETGYDRNSEEFYNAVAQRFEMIVQHSQPTYQMQYRAAYQRSSNEIVKALAMFRTQQTQNLNQLITAWYENKATQADENATAAEKKTAKSKYHQTLAGQIAAQTMFAFLSTAARLLLHKQKDYRDEDGNFDWGKVAKRIGLDLFESSLGTVWFGDQIAAVLVDASTGVLSKITHGKVDRTSEFYALNEAVTNLVNNTVSSLIKLVQNPTAKTVRNAALDLASLSGVPLRNAYNMLNSFLMYNADWVTVANPRHEDDYLSLIDSIRKMPDAQFATFTTERALQAYNMGRKNEATALMLTMAGDGFEKQIGKAIGDALAKGQIGDAMALRWMRDFANQTGEEAALTLGKAKVDYEYGKIEDDFLRGLDIDATLESLGIPTLNKANQAELESEVKSYLVAQKKAALADEYDVEYETDYDKVFALDDPLDFLGIKKSFGLSNKAQDFSFLDELFSRNGAYSKLSAEGRELLDSSYSRADDMYAAAQAGINAEEWTAIYDKYNELKNEDSSATSKAEAFKTYLSHTKYSASQQALLLGQFKFHTTLTAETTRYDKLLAAGLNNDTAQYYSGRIRESDADNEAEYLAQFVGARGSEADRERAMSVYLSDSAMERWQRAKAEGISLQNWARFVEEATKAHKARTGKGGSPSKADIETACKAMGWTGWGDTAQMYRIYNGK